MEGIRKVSNGYRINGFYVSVDNSLWKHTLDRVISFEEKCKSKEEFEKKMVTRLKRIKHTEKIYYTIAVLVHRGHQTVAEIYDSRLVLDSLTEDLDFLDEI